MYSSCRKIGLIFNLLLSLNQTVCWYFEYNWSYCHFCVILAYCFYKIWLPLRQFSFHDPYLSVHLQFIYHYEECKSFYHQTSIQPWKTCQNLFGLCRVMWLGVEKISTLLESPVHQFTVNIFESGMIIKDSLLLNFFISKQFSVENC